MTERNYDAALKEFEIAAHTMPNDPEILGRLGYLYRRQGRWREALENFRRVQELDPRIPHGDEAETAVHCATGRLPEFCIAICWSLPPMTSD